MYPNNIILKKVFNDNWLWKDSLNSDSNDNWLWKDSLNSDSQQCHKYQQNKQTTISHRKLLNQKNTTTYTNEISGSDLRQAQQYGCVIPVNGISILYVFISNLQWQCRY